MHELVIIETGHIDARFKHEVSLKKTLQNYSNTSIRYKNIYFYTTGLKGAYL